MAKDRVISWETLSNFEEVVSDIRKECYAIHVLWHEKIQPRCSEVRFSGDLDELIWCHLDLLDQAVGDGKGQRNLEFRCSGSGYQ